MKVDLRSVILILIPYLLGLPLLTVLFCNGHIGPLFTLLFSTLLMNLSFTAWHEACHGTLSRFSTFNTMIGILASLFTIYPGWYARRREHLAHHKFEGDPEKDPVWARIQCGFWTFLPKLAVQIIQRRNPIPVDFIPLNSRQILTDRLTVGVAIGALFVLGVFCGWEIVLLAWVLPRIFTFALHAIYICWLPHAVPSANGFETYRIRNWGAFGFFLLARQDLHGIHHRWPRLPWHKYSAKVVEFKRGDLDCGT